MSGRQAVLHEHVVPLVYVRTMLLPHIVIAPVRLSTEHKLSAIKQSHVSLKTDGLRTKAIGVVVVGIGIGA